MTHLEIYGTEMTMADAEGITSTLHGLIINNEGTVEDHTLYQEAKDMIFDAMPDIILGGRN